MARTFNIGAMKVRENSSSPWESTILNAMAVPFNATEISTEGTDLDDLTDPGVYFNKVQSDSDRYDNCPTHNPFAMFVLDTGNEYVIQIIATYSAMYTRRVKDAENKTSWYSYAGTEVSEES